MDENEIMTDEVMDETFEESEEYTDEGGFPVIPTVIGGVLVAGVILYQEVEKDSDDSE